MDSIEQIEDYLTGISEEQFKKNKEKQDAVIRRIEIIGEASRNVPGALKEKNKEFPWSEVAQFRDLMAHMYYEASLDRIWKTAKERIPKIKEILQKIKLV